MLSKTDRGYLRECRKVRLLRLFRLGSGQPPSDKDARSLRSK